MLDAIRARVLPEAQRRTLDELSDDLTLVSGDTRSKQSAFWTMLALSAVIASAGVLSDSTATVIGAMIIAPLSTPIMGIALGVVLQRRTGSVPFVVAGGLLVVLVGVLFALVTPADTDLLSNGQISGRTSPGLLDLVAAIATGFAGAVALARRDVGAVLPGVAIAISLVPPLAVVGVCLGHWDLGLALGAFLLFVSNLLSLVLAGVIMFAVLGYAEDPTAGAPSTSRRSHMVLGGLILLVTVPLAANTALSFLLTTWAGRIDDVTSQWVEDSPGAEVTGVDFVSLTAHVKVRHHDPLPSLAMLRADLDRVLPEGVSVVLETTVGREVEVGTMTSGSAPDPR
ncbi:DUF389 domain-containing protein [Nocardioides sp. Soil805]|uniref:DUF389 domain-containing protein n=1 Tax=Nocardioides sp. Soil805 TaxID=1736416 RepID=UPI0007031BFB|nr:DUF389 domain-containing protein [Nocardioides sp. Soil805]KRF36734.1 hypothetical protein ASG94_04770 [Nocardioides sp. Soil805]